MTIFRDREQTRNFANSQRCFFFFCLKEILSTHYNEDIEASLWEEALFSRTLQAVKEHDEEMPT